MAPTVLPSMIIDAPATGYPSGEVIVPLTEVWARRLEAMSSKPASKKTNRFIANSLFGLFFDKIDLYVVQIPVYISGAG